MSDGLNLQAGEFRGIIGVSRQDITPPPGIYARSWGAASHDIAEGIHRSMTLTTITLQQSAQDAPLVLISADLMSWRSRSTEQTILGAIRTKFQEAGGSDDRLMFCLTHTHAAPSIRTEDMSKPGGHLIGDYQKQVIEASLQSMSDARRCAVPATITWRYGRCDLATNRDLPEPGGSRIVCGYNASIAADDTLLVGRVCDDAGKIIATIVNYACHPTTLAWENKLISPDWIGAMRQTIESHTGAPCLFLQGASGELAPAEQYVADTRFADRHGRRVGFAALSTIEGMHAPGTRLTFQGIVESGAPLAVWKPAKVDINRSLLARQIEVELPLKEMPTIQQIDAQLESCDDPVLRERLSRQRAVRGIVGDGVTTKMPLWGWRVGDAILIGQPNEAYSVFQTSLRKQFAPRPISVMNLVNGSAGYLAPRELYDADVYQVWQSPFAATSLEILQTAAERLVHSLL